MPAFAPVHSAERRAAVILAALDARPTRNARQIVDAAQAGTLTGPDGQPLTAFALPLSTAQWWVREERRRRTTAQQPDTPPEQQHADADQHVADLRSRLLAVAEQHVRALEREGTRADPARISATARAVHDAARIGIAARASNGNGRGRADGRDAAAPEPEQPDPPRDFFDTLASSADDDTHDVADPDA